MFLSRLLLNPRSRQVQRDLADCGQMHRAIMTGFPNVEGTKARHDLAVLYRVEASACGQVQVLAQSSQEPDWEPLRARADYLQPGVGPNPVVKSIAAALRHIRAGDRLRFRLRANPTRRIGRGNNQLEPERWRGKRVELQRGEDQLTWLKRKGEGGGYRIERVTLAAGAPLTSVPQTETQSVDEVVGSPDGRSHGWQRDGVGRQRLTFGAVVFDGVLVVTDADAFREAVRRGIGSGKAYGFGLLSVAPAPTDWDGDGTDADGSETVAEGAR